MVFSVGLAWRKKQAEELRKAYHLAIDGAREGFYMVRAIYDGRGSPIDFVLVDCNERGASLIGSTKEHLIDMRFSAKLLNRMRNEQALQRAIKDAQFELYYQPRVDTFSGELRSMEALVRWRHPERGMVPPVEFIPLAEETGLIVGLGELVARNVCRQLAAWRNAGLSVVPVSINVSPRQFSQGGLSTLFTSCLVEYGLDSSLVDDFGTG
ncbi:EAL domain-containing protein [Noviherbaspirillum saxi]|uniref:EAL domain-containing protein n=1 Tax=Noviherbaspirillum saxi TaxID=2320863 RepID=A0A3A3FNV9_9BURK|nr:EAL domain-containing protein [Noviherbaspirillum saxi]RJF96175.1 EAL domain-containing protein [Noviherbaspirillum saxi]